MKRTKIEQLLLLVAWVGLIGGILFTTLVSKGIWESHVDMALQIVSISDKIRRIEEHLKEPKE